MFQHIIFGQLLYNIYNETRKQSKYTCQQRNNDLA